MIIWVQRWEESERGWGTRPDGYTLHIDREHIRLFEKTLRDREQEGNLNGEVPDEYSRPCGLPFQTDISDPDLLGEIAFSEHGIWGPGKTWLGLG